MALAVRVGSWFWVQDYEKHADCGNQKEKEKHTDLTNIPLTQAWVKLVYKVS